CLLVVVVQASFPVCCFFYLASATELHTSPYTTLFRSRSDGLVRFTRARPSASTSRSSSVSSYSSGQSTGKRCCFSQSPAKSSSRSEEHTSELQSRENLVCRLLLEKKNTTSTTNRRKQQ